MDENRPLRGRFRGSDLTGLLRVERARDDEATAAYGRMARWYEEHSRDSVCNAHYDRPAMLDLLGPVDGQDVLDAGCGPGWYAVALLDRGARVVALDGTPEMTDIARARLGSRARVILHDLERPPTPLPEAAFDAVVLALVIHHIDDRAGLLAELFRVLRPGGRLVLSTHHPIAAESAFLAVRLRRPG